MRHFEALDLSDNNINNEALKKLAGRMDLTRVKVLKLNNTQITSKGFNNLPARLPYLRRLELKNTFTIFTSDLLTRDRINITGFRCLVELDVSGTGMSDDQLKAVGSLPELRYLDLSNTVVPNKGVEEGLNGSPGAPPLNVILTNTKATPLAANARLDAIRGRKGASAEIQPAD